ncbi:hypothetical protein PRIC2_012879 [Phytophthora ramorum]
MQSDDFMFSPMDSAGEERLRLVRACIRVAYGPGATRRRTKRALDMPAAQVTPAKIRCTNLGQRIERASHESTHQRFFQGFGTSDEPPSAERDLTWPAPTTSAASTRAAPQQGTGRPITFFSSAASSSATTAFTSSLPAPSTANVNQLSRPTRIRTPRKAAIKRARTGESSAEKVLVLRKPRIEGTSSSARSVHFSNAAAAPAFDARKSFAFVTNRGDHLMQPSASTRFLSRTSPSKFQFSSNASRLFSQRQAPLR